MYPLDSFELSDSVLDVVLLFETKIAARQLLKTYTYFIFNILDEINIFKVYWTSKKTKTKQDSH